MGSLCDGSKIIVFSGTLEPDSGKGCKDIQICNLKLLVNSVRKAFISSPLGFVYPPMLTRGLSLKSISIGTYVSYTMLYYGINFLRITYKSILSFLLIFSLLF